MDVGGGPAEEFDGPKLLCEELEESETQSSQRNISRRRTRRTREREEWFSRRKKEDVVEYTEQKERGDDQNIEDSAEEVMAKEGEKEQVSFQDREMLEEEQNKTSVADKQKRRGQKNLQQKDEHKKSRKKRSRKQSEQAKKKKVLRDVTKSHRLETSGQTAEVPVMNSGEGSAQSELPIGLMNSCELADPVYVGFEGAGLYCSSLPIPPVYSSQRPAPTHAPAPNPQGPKRPHSPPPPSSSPAPPLTQQDPQPPQVEITEVHSTRRSIRYSTKGRGRVLGFNLLPGLDTVDSCLLQPAPRKKTRTLYTTDQIKHLEALFQEDHYPDAEKRKLIAMSVGVTPQRIMVWFQNRRAKWRKGRSVTKSAEHKHSLADYSGGSPHQLINPNLPTLASTNMGASSFPAHFVKKYASVVPCFPAQTPPTYSTSLPSSPGQFSASDTGQCQLSSQEGLAEYHPPPMHSPPPLRRASFPIFTSGYNSLNSTPPLLSTPAHTLPFFMDSLEGGSTLAYCDTQSQQTESSPLFDFMERLDYLSSSQQTNAHSYPLQASYSISQPQNQSQASHPQISYLTPSPYLTPNPPDSNPTSYLTFGPGGNSSGVMTYSTGGHSYFESQSAGQVLLHSGHHGSDLYVAVVEQNRGGISSYPSYLWGTMYNQPAMQQHTACPLTYSTSLDSALDQQNSSASLSLPPLFPQSDRRPSHGVSQCSSQSQTHTTTSTTSLPPVSSLHPLCLRKESTPSEVSALLPSQVSCPESPPTPPCVKLEYDSPREIHSHFHCDFSPIHF